MTADVHTLVGAYVLDALDDAERASFERHLASCSSCQAEVDGFRSTAARLGAAAAEAPPPGLRDRVLAEVDVTRQRPAWARVRPLRRVALPAVAAVVALAVVLGAAVLLRGDPSAADPEDVAAVLAAPDARTVPVTTTDGGLTANVVTAPSADRALLAFRGLPEQGEAVYVLWALRGGAPVNERSLPSGTATVIVEDLATASQVVVTLEPRADVPAPTGPVVAQAELR